MPLQNTMYTIYGAQECNKTLFSFSHTIDMKKCVKSIHLQSSSHKISLSLKNIIFFKRFFFLQIYFRFAKLCSKVFTCFIFLLKNSTSFFIFAVLNNR